MRIKKEIVLIIVFLFAGLSVISIANAATPTDCSGLADGTDCDVASTISDALLTGKCQSQICVKTTAFSTAYDDCISQGGDYDDCKDREGAPSASTNPCVGKTDGISCTADGGVAGECSGEICIRCGQAGDACESSGNCCSGSGLSCVSMICTSSSGGTNPTGDASGGTNPTGDAAATGAKCDSANFKEIAGVCFPSNTGLAETSISDILKNALFWLLGIFGFFGIAGFVISGIQYLTSAGDDKMIETAKRNMKWSLIGVVVGISGMVIIKAITAALQATTSSF